MNMCRVEADIFHMARETDGWTDMPKLIVAFRNFANALKNRHFWCVV
jgi:hypothetical protein